jgi:hypothetical protein
LPVLAPSRDRKGEKIRSPFEQLWEQPFDCGVKPVDLVLMKMIPIRGSKEPGFDQGIGTGIALEDSDNLLCMIPSERNLQH